MRKILIFLIVFFPIDIFGQGIECFTHPICGFPITLFSMPSTHACLKELQISGEAGYEVEEYQKQGNAKVVYNSETQETSLKQ